jgi:hypothetical protein
MYITPKHNTQILDTTIIYKKSLKVPFIPLKIFETKPPAKIKFHKIGTTISNDTFVFNTFLDEVPHELSFIFNIAHIFAGNTIVIYTKPYKK